MSASDQADRLVTAARQARDHAIATYSHFKVGAALLLPNGQIVTGCNVENVSYIVGAAVAVLVAVVASLGPARRAASVQPMLAMRSN